MIWTQIDVITTPEASEAVADLFLETGATGTSIQEHADSSTVTAFFPNDDLIGERVSKLHQRLGMLKEYGLPTGAAEIQLTRLEDEDWATTWKSSFPPQHIGKHWLVVPSWEPIQPAPDERLIVLDPGMAFGTGYHPTTKLVLSLLEEIVQGGESVLDLGTGSGILAIASAKLAADSVLATDIDDQAIPIAQENARINEVAEVIEWRQGSLFDGVEGRYDLILANILAKVILPMIPECKRFLKPGGKAIFSGILQREDPVIQQALAHAGLRCLKTECMDEWIAYLIS